MIKAGVKILGSWLLVIDVWRFHNSNPMALVMSAVEVILMMGNSFCLRSFKFMLFDFFKVRIFYILFYQIID
jgi:hypothetical protein